MSRPLSILIAACCLAAWIALVVSLALEGRWLLVCFCLVLTLPIGNTIGQLLKYT